MRISTFDDLEALAQHMLSNEPGHVDIAGIDWELPLMTIHYTDHDYSGFIDTDMMGIFLKLQKRIYRDLGYAVYGKSAINKLTREEKQSLLLHVKVEKGSNIDKINLNELIRRIIGKMDSKDLKKTIYFVTTVVCITILLSKSVNVIMNYKIKQSDNNLTAQSLAEYNNLSSMMFEYLSTKENVEVNGVPTTVEELQEIGKEKKEMAKSIVSSDDDLTTDSISGRFIVSEFKNNPEYSVTLVNVDTVEVFKPKLGKDPSERIDALAIHAARKTESSMILTVARTSEGKIIEARIEDIDGTPFYTDLLNQQ